MPETSPEIAGQPSTYDAREDVEPLAKAIEALEPDWEVERKEFEWESTPKESSIPSGGIDYDYLLPPSIPIEVLLVIVGAAARSGTDELIALAKKFAREHWKKRRRRVAIVLMTEDGERIHRVSAPRVKPSERRPCEGGPHEDHSSSPVMQ